eukprot:jgi/Orpsp1_1/1183131/evm.model.c7180000084014.1
MDELVDFKKWKIPLKIKYAENKGRYVIATQNFSKDSRIVAIKGYSVGIIDSYKKKICSVCLSINNDGFYDISCKSCNVAYYCSKACQMYSQRKLNHDMVCPLLRRLSTFKSDIHSKSIMKLLLNSLSLRKSEEEYMNEIKNNQLLQEKTINNSNEIYEWLSLVPLPSDIEVYEKEIEEMKKELKMNNENNKDDEEGKKKDNKEELIEDEISELIKNDDSSSDSNDEESEKKEKKKSKNKKKHKKKDKEKNDDSENDNEDTNNKKKHNHKKDKKKNKKKHNHKKDKKKSKKDKKEEEGEISDDEKERKEKKKSKKDKKKGEESDDENQKKEKKKDKSKHKHSIKHTSEEEINENNEENDTNTDKYDIITNTIPYSGTFKDMMNLQSHYEEWTD